jgi:hypothetical protein
MGKELAGGASVANADVEPNVNMTRQQAAEAILVFIDFLLKRMYIHK